MVVSAKPRFRGRRLRETRSFYLFVGPWLIGFVVLGIFPLVLGLATSFTNYDGFNLDHVKFLGPSNYTRAFADGEAIVALSRTVYFSVLSVPLGIVLALAIAIMLNQSVPARGGFRT